MAGNGSEYNTPARRQITGHRAILHDARRQPEKDCINKIRTVEIDKGVIMDFLIGMLAGIAIGILITMWATLIYLSKSDK